MNPLLLSGRALRRLAFLALPLLLGGCNLVVLSPSGEIAQRQAELVLISTALMLIIILPVMVLTGLFAWRYRAANRQTRYEPEWDHSTGLELVIWAAPLIIIICLGALTWAATHLLDPYRPLARSGPEQEVAAAERPLDVNVVALDWKWLFILPEYGIATVNELAAPVDRPIRFRITATEVMNSFYIPALAGQIYAMPGMETKLHAVINRTGDFEGFSANYSGAGFSQMRFRFHGLSEQGFRGWVARVRQSSLSLDRAAFAALRRPSQNDPVRHYASVDPSLFGAVVRMCAEPGQTCTGHMHGAQAQSPAPAAIAAAPAAAPAADAHAGHGAGHGDHAAMPAAPVMPAAQPVPAPAGQARLTGAGLRPPAPLRFRSLTASQPRPES